MQLVCNLLDEGNSCFRDGDCRQATHQYGEGVSVARYAQAEALVIPHELLESLYVNRAAACYQTVRGNVSLADAHVDTCERKEGMFISLSQLFINNVCVTPFLLLLSLFKRDHVLLKHKCHHFMHCTRV